MSRIASVFSLVFFLVFIACGDKYRLQLQSPKTIKVDQPLKLSVKDKNGNPIDSVSYAINGIRIQEEGPVDVSQYKLGKQVITATVYYAGKKKQLNNTIYFLGNQSPKVYNYELVNEFPHDEKAFTQGFVYKDGYFYESTGQYGKSTLRKVEIETGKVLQKKDIDKAYFGEGMTIMNDKIYMLTWKKKIGFIFNLETFEQEGTFDYGESKEGWGLTHNTVSLIKSDGTERIWFLNPESLKEEKYIEAYTNKRKAQELNELEYIKGKIYANIWQQNSLLIINPKNGAIEGIANLKGLQAKAGQTSDDNVLNGIAYDEENDRLFVTGKKWNKVFEIKLLVK